jgi:cytoskeletal protein RodZ
MAPLDTGSMSNILRFAEPPGRGPGPSPSQYHQLGGYLRAVREHKDLSLVQVAEVTRVRKVYLAAIESGDLTPLPSRPFAVGYVRAYAKSLGLDGDAAAARFKAEHPEADQQLRAPVGVAQEKDSRRRVIYAVAAVLVVAVGIWNVAQRSLITNAPGGPAMPALDQPLPDPEAKGPVALGPATPPPADQTTPRPYIVPGLGVPGIDNSVDPKAAPPPAPEMPPEAPAAAAFTPKGTVYGVDAKVGAIVVQARKSASLVVRGPGGAIFFARELKAGEAYRAPLGRGLTADVSDPGAIELYVSGRFQGLLSDPQTPLDKAAADPAKSVAKGSAQLAAGFAQAQPVVPHPEAGAPH